jgi:hypothetical protein
MSEISSRRCVGRRLPTFAACGRLLATLGACCASCLPERSLASYGNGTPSAPTIASATPASPSDAGEPVSFGAKKDVARFDAGLKEDGSTGILVCRDECACERRRDRDFMFCGTSVSYADAAARCASAGGTLANVDDPEQNAWLTERMQALARDDFWLSGTDEQDEGIWRWQDGRVFYDRTGDASSLGAFAPWDGTQPNDLNGEDCMRSIDGTWRDLDCTEEIAYVCQG